MNGDNFMCKWMLKTENAVARGARFEVYKQGLLKATFTPQNRLSFVEFAYDVMNVMQQLRRTTGDHDFQVIPNTLPLAYEPSPDPRVITESMAPFKITFANEVTI